MARKPTPRDPDHGVRARGPCPQSVERARFGHWLPVVNPRIEIGVRDVSQEVRDNGEYRADEDDRHEQRIVIAERGLDKEPSHARPRENGLRSEEHTSE